MLSAGIGAGDASARGQAKAAGYSETNSTHVGSIVADQNASLFAGRDIAIAAARQTQTQTASASSSKSGLMSSGIGVTLGSQSQTGDNQGASTTAVASTVGSIGGNVGIVAGNRVGIVGSDLVTPAGDIAIAGKSVVITEARDTAASQSRQTVEQSGLTLSVTAPALAALQSAGSTLDAIGNTQSGRMQALGAASAAMSANTAIGSLQGAGAAVEAGASASEVAKQAGVGLNITVGGSKSSSTSSQKSDTARASTIDAGGSIAITATGAGKDSNITLQGVQANAGRDVDLKADGDINLLAARNDSEQHSSNKSSSASIGVGITLGPQGTAFGVTAAASSARGQADGSDTTWSGTRIAAGNTARIESGGDTTLRGASVAANTVQATIGGDLTIESLQDTSRYDSQQHNAGGSITVNLNGGVTGSASIGNAKVKGDYASVTDPSGWKAGDGGFQIDVGGKTSLKGGAITSSDAAVQSGANRFASAGGTTLEDIRNRDDYKASGASLSGGYGKSEGSGNNPGNLQDYAGGLNGATIGVGSAKGSQSSTTASAISGIAGDTQARTGDKRSGALAKAWDGQQLDREVQAQKQITATFGQQATKAVGDYASAQYERLKNTDPAEAAKWAEGGVYRVAAHTVIGGLTGGLQGAVGAGTSQAVIDRIGQQIASADLPPGLKTALVAIAGTSVGAAVGGGAGAAAAGNATVNNYLSAADLRSREQKLGDCRSQGNPQCEVNVIREYELKSAKNTGAIDYRSVVSVDSMQQDKSALQQLLQDPNISAETRVQAQKSITELDRAINVIQRSPVIQDAMQMGLMVVDVATLGEMAGARMLTTSVVKEFLASRGTQVTEAQASRIAENFYKEVPTPAADAGPPVRPTPRQSEIDVGLDLPPGARPQVSFKNGQEVPYGTSGSVRPDYCLGNVCSVEVKNYNIATNSNGLINNVSQQAIDRAANLPQGMTQTVVIDVRGQVLTAAQEDAVVRGIVQKSNGAINPTSISFKR